MIQLFAEHLEKAHHFIIFGRLDQVAFDAQFHGLSGIFKVAVGADKDDGCSRREPAYFSGKSQAVHSRHFDISEDYIHRVGPVSYTHLDVYKRQGNHVVRCIMLQASEGLHRDMEVTATGAGIQVPVGKKTLGRLFNVLGEAIDGGEGLESEEHWVIHREPPTFEEQSPVVEILETGIKVIDPVSYTHL